MPAYAVRLLDAARDDIAALDRSVATRIVSRLRWLAECGAEMRSDALKGDLAGLFKLRVGAYRVFYEVRHDENVILVHAVGHRRDVYRRQ